MTKKLLILILLLGFAKSEMNAQQGTFLEFDGSSRYMTIPSHADFNFTTSQEFSITLWVNVKSYKTNARFVSKRGDGTALDKSGYEMWGTNSASNFYALNTPLLSGSNPFSQWGTIAGATNTWIHLGFVVSRANGLTTVYQYQNGQLAKSSTGINMEAYASTNSFDVYIGNGQYTSSYLNAKIDDLRFWRKGLTAQEVAADMISSVTASTEGLVAAYDFENIDGHIVPDIKNTHPATLYNFPSSGPVVITNATVLQDANFTGRANANEVILKATINTTGSTASEIEYVTLDMTGTTSLIDVDSIKIFTTGSVNKFDYRNPAGELLGSALPANGTLTIPTKGQLQSGVNYLWITYNINSAAKEGNKVDAALLSLKTANETYNFSAGNPSGSREILLARTLVFGPGDFSSTNYRIPAIITADDGALVTLTDKRKFNSTDLPEDIDVLARRSTDGGLTWSDPVTVARGTGRNAGFGDAVLLKGKSGKLIAVYVGGPGLWQSTPSNPIRTYVSTSSDHGKTWTTPRDITHQLFGADNSDPVRSKWYASFCGAGHGLTMRSGRLMVVGTVRETTSTSLNNYAYYSDNEGLTWNVSSRAIQGGDEAKVVELNNGDILMSSRTSGNRLWAKSSDGGITWGSKNSWPDLWGNACNGDMIRFTSTKDGFSKNRILHTLPNASDRSNLTVFMSYDEGTSWPVKKTVCAGKSAYASLTILPDGTIGVYSEEDESVPYKMYFLNFSLEWLSNGADQYVPAEVSGVTDLQYDSRIRTDNNIIMVEGVADFEVFNIAGEQIPKNTVLPTGVYVVKFNEIIKKVMVR